MSTVLQLTSRGVGDTMAIGAAIARMVRGGDVIALIGELGAGKTQLVRGLAEGLGLDAGRVSSPTFVLMHEYEPRGAAAGALTLVHIDAYRVQSLGDLESLGWSNDEDLRRHAVVAVEWADRLNEPLGREALVVRIQHADDGCRGLLCEAGAGWASRWEDLRELLRVYGREAAGTPCPICRRPVHEDEATFPFCSNRCRTIDLGRWIDRKYTISRPVEQSDLEEGVD